MLNNVSFQYPAKFIPWTDEDRVVAAAGANWFVALLHSIPELQVDDDLCQEDWGVVVFASRSKKRFWIGLSSWDTEGAWLAHIHHGSLLQRFTSAGKSELARLARDLHLALKRTASVSSITWYDEREMSRANPQGYQTPDEMKPSPKEKRCQEPNQ